MIEQAIVSALVEVECLRTLDRLRLAEQLPDDEIRDGDTLTIDLASASLTLPTNLTRTFAIDPFAQKCLLSGQDELAYLLAQQESIAEYERRHL